MSLLQRVMVLAGGLSAGLAWCLALTVVDWAAWFLVLPGRKPGSLARELDPDPAEESLGEPIRAVAADGVTLAGVWHAAGSDAGGHGRTVLVLHGFAEDPSTLRGRMEALGRHGWNVAALDTRSHGRSGGDRTSFGGRESADVLSWLDALGRLGKLGPSPGAGVWGRSMGAAVAIRAAADDPRVAALVLESPYADLEQTLVSILLRKHVPFPRLTARAIMNRASTLAGVSLTRPRPIDLAPRINVPILIVHGAEDRLTPLSVAERLACAFPQRATIVDVPDSGHNSVIEVGGLPLLERIAGFLDDSVGRTDIGDGPG